MSGFAARTSPSVGVHDALQARAAAFVGAAGRPVVLIVADVIGLDARSTRRVRRRLRSSHGLPAERVAVVATHTHGGPPTLPRAFLGPVEPAVLRAVEDAAVGAARRALDALAPATLRHASAELTGVARNRRDADGPADPRVDVLWAERAGEPVGVLATFALHPVVLGPDNLLLTRDFPGFAVDALERAFPGCVALFANGCAGQINHGHAASASWTVAPSATRTYEVAAAIGERIGAAAAGAMRSGGDVLATAGELRAVRRRVQLPLSPPPTDPAADALRWRDEIAQARETGDADRVALLEPLVTWAETVALGQGGQPARRAAGFRDGRGGPLERSGRTARTSEVQAFGLVGRALVLLPGEPFVEYGLALRRAFGGRVVPLGYANDAPGYLPAGTAFAAGGYEVDTAYRYYGSPAPYDPATEARLLGAAWAAASAVLEERNEAEPRQARTKPPRRQP